jgi:HEAT repeat protein
MNRRHALALAALYLSLFVGAVVVSLVVSLREPAAPESPAALAEAPAKDERRPPGEKVTVDRATRRAPAHTGKSTSPAPDAEKPTVSPPAPDKQPPGPPLPPLPKLNDLAEATPAAPRQSADTPADEADEPPPLAKPIRGRAGEDPVADLIKALQSKNVAVRKKATRILGSYGIGAKAAVPALVAVYTAKDCTAEEGAEVFRTLAQIGPASVPQLARALEDGPPQVRKLAAWALGIIGPEARAALPQLEQALKDKSAQVRFLAAYALGEMGPLAREATPALARRLRDPDPAVRARAAEALREIGTDAVPALTDLLKDPQPEARLGAVWALALLGPKAKPAVPALGQFVAGGDAKVRVAAIITLGALGTDASEALPYLYQALEMKHLETQQRALQAILVVGRGDVPTMLKKLRAIDRRGQWATPYILGQFGPKVKDAVMPLAKALEDPEATTRLGAALALGRIGPDAAEAIASLEKRIDDPDAQVAAAVRWALVVIDQEPKKQAAAKKALDEAQDLVLRQLRETQRVIQAHQLAKQEFRDAKQGVVQAQLDLIAKQKALQQAFVGGPQPGLRKAMTDPVVQAHYDRVVRGMVLAIGTSCEGSMTVADNIMASLPPEAIPALVRGINQVATYNLGFC